MDLIKRSLETLVRERLGQFPAVIVEGPRQSGKTTLVRQFIEEMGSYHSLEDERLLGEFAIHGGAFLPELGQRLILDEIQQWPGCLRAVKRMIDEQPKVPGQFLLTGSASIRALAGEADSLAGRACFLTLLPLSQAEICGRPAGLLLEYLFSQQHERPDFVGSPRQLGQAIHVGGYPRLLECKNRRQRAAWLRNYFQALQRRDIPALANLRGSRVVDVLHLLAACATGVLNVQRCGQRLQMHSATLNKVVNVLEDLKVISLLPRYNPGENTFMHKRQQIQFTDSGLLATILKVSEPAAEALLTGGRTTGALFETFVFGEIAKQCNCADRGHEIGFWKDAKSRREVDLVLALEGRIVGIQITSASIANERFLAGLKLLAERAPAMQRGVVIYSGDSFLSTTYKSRYGRVIMQFVPASWLWADDRPQLL